MNYAIKNIWRLCAIISGACLVALLLFLAVYGIVRSNKSDYVVWPKDEVDQLKLDNASAIDQARNIKVQGVRALDKRDHVLGDSQAKVILISYLDFDCPYCISFYPTLIELNKLYGNKLAIAIRNFPLDSHPLSLGAANAFECAAEQGKWREAMEALFKLKDKTQAEFMVMAKNLKLNQIKFKDCLTSGKYLSVIEADKAEADLAGVGGTPTSFLNGLILPGAYKINDFNNPAGGVTKGLKTLIDKELGK